MNSLTLSAKLAKTIQGTKNPEILVEVKGELYPIQSILGHGKHAIILLADSAIGELPAPDPHKLIEVPVETIDENTLAPGSTTVAIEVEVDEFGDPIEDEDLLENEIIEDVPNELIDEIPVIKPLTKKTKTKIKTK